MESREYYKESLTRVDESIRPHIERIFTSLLSGSLILVSNKYFSLEELKTIGIDEDVIFLLKAYNMVYDPKDGTRDKVYLTNALVKLFFEYGVGLFLEDNYSAAAEKCFKICCDTERTMIYNYQYALILIKRGKFKEAYSIISNLKIRGPEDIRVRIIRCRNLFLFLLNYFFDYVLKEMFVATDELSARDLCLINSDVGQQQKLKSVGEMVCKIDFKQAWSELNVLYDYKTNYSVEYELIRTLLSLSLKRQKKLVEELSSFVEQKEYKKIFKILKCERERRKLSSKEMCIMLIAAELDRLSRKRTFVEPITIGGLVVRKGSKNLFSVEEMLEAICGGNFELAIAEYHKFRDLKGVSDVFFDRLICDLERLISAVKEEDVYNNGDNKDDIQLEESTSASLNLSNPREGQLLLNIPALNLPLYELHYPELDKEVLIAHSNLKGVIGNSKSREEISALSERQKCLMKLVYARYCYYYAAFCYDMAFKWYMVRDYDTKKYTSLVKLYDKYIGCADMLVEDVEKNGDAFDSCVLSFLDSVKKYKKFIIGSYSPMVLEKK